MAPGNTPTVLSNPCICLFIHLMSLMSVVCFYFLTYCCMLTVWLYQNRICRSIYRAIVAAVAGRDCFRPLGTDDCTWYPSQRLHAAAAATAASHYSNNSSRFKRLAAGEGLSIITPYNFSSACLTSFTPNHSLVCQLYVYVSATQIRWS